MPKIITDKKAINEFLERGVAEVIVRDHLKERLMAGDKLRIKLGIDPTGSVLHLGHSVVLRKLKGFQDLGHQVIFLIGDFTARIGDPTGRSETRKPMTDQEIKKNMKSYREQAGLILNMKKVEVRYNSEWLSKMDLKEIISLTSKVTYAQMAQRADFKERIKKEQDLSVQEFLYPAMQGYDSVELKADVEIGGTDQKFNLLMGRQLQKRYGQEPQDIITCTLLEGLDGRDKMSKSVGNYIALTEDSNSMFGKIMSLPDSLIARYFELCTDTDMIEVNKISKNPRDAKLELACEIVKIYHGKKKAQGAKEYFEKVFSRKEIPDEVKTIDVKVGEKLIDILVRSELASSKADARRKIEQGGVRISGVAVKNLNRILDKSSNNQIINVGKKEFRKIVVKLTNK